MPAGNCGSHCTLDKTGQWVIHCMDSCCHGPVLPRDPRPGK